MKHLKYLELQIILLMICSFSYAQESKKDSAYYYYKKAKQFDFENKHFKAYKNYIKSLNLYKKINLEDSVAKCNLELFELIISQSNLEKSSKPYLDDYYQYTLKKNDSFLLLKSLNRYAEYYWNTDSIELPKKYYLKSLQLTKNKKLSKYSISIYSNLAFLHTKKYPDSAAYYFKKTLDLKELMSNNQLIGTYINYALFFQNQQKYNDALKYLKKADSVKIETYQLKYKKIIYENFSNAYKSNLNYKKAFEYLKKYNTARDSLNNTAQNIAISDLDKKYQTEKKEKHILSLEKENLETEAKNKQQKNLIIGSILFIIFGGTIATLSLKNSKRKRKLAEQEKKLESQKNLTLLKEQEINTINAMVEGQEKERKRVAEDLHDNLGSVLATLKLHFDNLKINSASKKINQEELFNKTENLIDEAYLKVRRIAHAKNAGVIANQGLLPAVQMMAEKISSADKIKIDVIDFGLHQRFNNALEITIFRIIQELITNILKHANAKNATINIAIYDNVFNLIVEDDGDGFDLKKVNLKDGIGINSIETRVNHLKGNFVIDTTLGKGSSFIIDIPIA
ncbi:ATP-binding protein [uncultured Polaribacter sp.]|uniref:sensor histidine kinase n=1 Tax=uncultured Polaribacter sp. TaxID=174711 RepID=UPI00262319C8|nr:ATP-binding protein [uncultured Polaribacter sp.]